jgi:agmatine deiminase
MSVDKKIQSKKENLDKKQMTIFATTKKTNKFTYLIIYFCYMKIFIIVANLALLIAFSMPATAIYAQQIKTEKESKPIKLQHWMTEEEARLKYLIGKDSRATDPPPGPVTNFAEFDQVQSVLIRYEFGISYPLIAAMSQKCGVTTIVTESNLNNVINQYQNQGVNMDNCDFIIASTNSYWTRDYGPWFVFDGNDEIGVVDFEYNRPRPLDNAIPAKVAQHLNVNYFATNLLHTGGNYMTDGMGISASTDIVHSENSNYTQAQIAQIMQNYYGIHTYHVVPDPNNTYIDHIDCWGKYLAPDKILIRSVPTNHPQYNEIEATAAYFAAQTSSYGTPLQVFRVNTPNNQPYTNSLILNDRVFVPIMSSSWDAQALQVYQVAMPGYEVLGFTGSWQSTDALHCRTIGITDIEKVHIHHVPLLGEQPVQNDYTIEATIKAFSGQALHSDSSLIYYRVNGAEWQTITMSNTTGQQWSGVIPGAMQGSEIEYYLFASDQAGKRQNHPFIGIHDPHRFYVGTPAFAHISINPQMINATVTAGQTTSEILTICNVGELELYFNIEANTMVYEPFIQAVPNSPSSGAYNYNTYSENGWTDIPITENGELAGVEVSFTWATDNWPEEGSFHLQSPTGTTAVIANGIPNGNYAIQTNAFEGEEVNGNWKLWIQDTYGDGGHQATNIIIEFTIAVSQPDWLSAGPISGSVAPGECINIGVLMNATDLIAGLYEGFLLVNSNDPDQPEIEIPVELIVTAVQDVVVTPDTLSFLTYADMIAGKLFNIENPTQNDIIITDITEAGSNFMWMIEPPIPTLPYTLGSGEDIELKVVIYPPPKSHRTNMLYDDLVVTTEYGEHTMVIAWDADLNATNATLTPDVLYFLEIQDFLVPHTVYFTNESIVPLTLYDIQEEGGNEFYWYVSGISVALPHEMLPQESITFDVWVPITVSQKYFGIQYDSISVISDAGVDYLQLVCDTDLVGVSKNETGSTRVYPVPFDDFLTVEHFNSNNQEISIEIIDIQGNKIIDLHNGTLMPGNHIFNWNGTDRSGKKFQSGIWFIRISTPEKTEVIKILKMK